MLNSANHVTESNLRTTVLAFALAIAATPGNAQSQSASMAQCAALMQNAAGWAQADETANRLKRATRAWHDASVARARAEGMEDAEARMTAAMEEQASAWKAEGAGFFYTQEFRNRAAYCKKFARAEGIDLTR